MTDVIADLYCMNPVKNQPLINCAHGQRFSTTKDKIHIPKSAAIYGKAVATIVRSIEFRKNGNMSPPRIFARYFHTSFFSCLVKGGSPASPLSPEPPIVLMGFWELGLGGNSLFPSPGAVGSNGSSSNPGFDVAAGCCSANSIFSILWIFV